MCREGARHLVKVDDVFDVAFYVAERKACEVHFGVEVAGVGVIMGVGVEVPALVEVQVQAPFGAFFAAHDEAWHAQVHVGQRELLVAPQVAVAEAGMADAYVVELQRPIARRGVLFLVGLVAFEVLYQAAEVEAVAVLQHLGVEAGEGDVAQVEGLEGQLQQGGAHVEGVEAGKDRGAVLFVEVEPMHLDAACQQVDTHALHLHTAAGQLLTVLVDVAFGDGARQERHDNEQGQHDADHPQQYFDNLFHNQLS